MRLTAKQREDVRTMFGGKCAYCGIALSGKWHVDHVEAVRYDYTYRHGTYDGNGQYTPSRIVKNGKMLRPQNDVIGNMFPACIACNIDKGAEPLEDWRQYLQGRMIDVMRRDIPNFRHAERFGLLIVKVEPIVFWFEKFAAREEQ